MLSQNDIITRLKAEKPLLEEKFYVRKIGLFGSFGRNEANENSDIDLVVEIDAPLEIYRKVKEELRLYLQKIFGRNVDLANPKSLKPHYKSQIHKQTIYA